METAVGVHYAFVPIGDFCVIDIDRILDASKHLVRCVRVIDEECVRLSCGFEGVIGEHACDADVSTCERKRSGSHGLEDYRGGRLLEVGREKDVRGGKRIAQFVSIVRFFGIKLEDADEVAVLLRDFLVVVPFGVFRRNAHNDEGVLLGDVREDGRKRFGCIARFHVHVAVDDKLVRKIHVELAPEARLRSTLRFFDGELRFVVEIPKFVVDSELDAEELFAVTVEEPAKSTGEVRVEHGVAVAGRGEQHLVCVKDAGLEEADLAPKFIAVHIEIFRRETDFFDFTRMHMEVVGDVVDVEKKWDVVECVLINGMTKGADEGSSPFVSENGLELDSALGAVREHRRGEHGKSQVVVVIRKGMWRAVDMGATEIFLIVYIGVEGVVIGTPNLEGLVLQGFYAFKNALILVGIDDMVLIKGRAGHDLRPCIGKSLCHAVYCGRKWTRCLPVPRFWSYDEYIH